MKKMDKKIILYFQSIIIFLFFGCKAPQEDGETKTVHIPQSTVKSQDDAGHCWAYAIAGYIESLQLKDSNGSPGVEYDLSESYWAFNHYYDSLKWYLKSSNPLTSLSKLKEGRNTYMTLLSLSVWGALPESDYSIEFSKWEERGDPSTLIKNHFEPLFSDEATLQSYRDNNELLREELGKLLGKLPPKPYDFITIAGKQQTPQQFLKNQLNFHYSHYKKVSLKNLEEKKALHYIKQSLLAGTSVLLSFTYFKKGLYAGEYSLDNCRSRCQKNGSHASIIVDYVSEGGEGGVMKQEEIEATYNNPIEYFIIKNSYGSNPSKSYQQDGDYSFWGNSGYGYYRLFKDYYDKGVKEGSSYIILPKTLKQEIDNKIAAGELAI